MKKAGKIIVFVSAILSAIFSLLFVFIEARILFSGDYKIYADPSAGFTTTFFRLIVAILVLGCSVPSLLVFTKKKLPSLGLWVEGTSIIIFFVSLVLSIHLDFSYGADPLYLSIPMKVIGSAFLLGAILIFIGANKKAQID